MEMIKEDYVSFETAKLLKKKGFDSICRAGYTSHGLLKDIEVKEYLTNISCPDTYWECTAPTLQMAMKWLRKVYNIAINIGWGEIFEDEFQWWYIILNIKDGSVLRESEYCITYEQACEAAIKYCLENLI